MFSIALSRFKCNVLYDFKMSNFVEDANIIEIIDIKHFPDATLVFIKVL